MASEWARRKVEQIVKLAECIHADDCEGPYGEEPCDCWVDEVRQEIAAALDEARREGAERERWECWRVLYSRNFPAWISTNPQYKALEWGAKAIAARGPMRGPEEEPNFRDVLATRCLRHATIPPTILPPAEQECGICMRDEGILSGRSEQLPERAWLIESRFTPAPTWWMGTDHPAPWTQDSLKAVRFCRKQDAENAMAALQDGHLCFVSEHQWGLGGPMRGPEEE